MRIEEELFAQAIGREIVQYIKNRDLTPKTVQQRRKMKRCVYCGKSR